MSKLDEFLGTNPFFTGEDNSISFENLEESHKLIDGVLVELEDYIKDRMGDDDYFIHMNLPVKNLHLSYYNDKVDENSDYIVLPYMSCSMNVFWKLREDKDSSPIFKVAKYIHDKTAELRGMLIEADFPSESVITDSVLSDYNINEFWSLHSFEFAYKYF